MRLAQSFQEEISASYAHVTDPAEAPVLEAWEVFRQEKDGDPMRHGGSTQASVSGPELSPECGSASVTVSVAAASGATGLHILLPLGARYTYEQARTFARLLAVLGVEAEPEISTVARPLRDRGGKVYIDFGQNGHGQTIVAPFSLRPLPGAPTGLPAPGAGAPVSAFLPLWPLKIRVGANSPSLCPTMFSEM